MILMILTFLIGIAASAFATYSAIQDKSMPRCIIAAGVLGINLSLLLCLVLR